MTRPTSSWLDSLPGEVREAVRPLFEALPIESAMPSLTPSLLAAPEHMALAEEAAKKLSNPALLAGLWLYVDDLDRSHRISQSLTDATGSYWHAIMHRREGDFQNSKYWLHQVGRHPAMDRFGYDALKFVDEVALRHRENPSDLLDVQRREWRMLFAWCAENSRPGA